MQLLSSGAEATIYLDRQGRVVKDRVPKGYRDPRLDKSLRRSRTRREAAILRTVPVAAPRLLDTDGERRITMEFVEGALLKRILDDEPGLAHMVGETVARLHAKNIIHGDLTTSNMLLREGTVVLIDFGLSFTSPSVEDKAVDLHLLRQALESKHHRVWKRAFEEFLRGYSTSENARKVVERLRIVERRGRNKVKA